MSDLIEAARSRKSAAERRLAELREEVAFHSKEVARWESFIADAEALARDVNGGLGTLFGPDEPNHMGQPNGRVQVRAGTLVALAAVILRGGGPQTAGEIADKIQAGGHKEGVKDLRTYVNTALWRRKDDLVEKSDDGRYRLRTTDFDIVGEEAN